MKNIHNFVKNKDMLSKILRVEWFIILNSCKQEISCKRWRIRVWAYSDFLLEGGSYLNL
jgi:hypothetical protein